MNMQEMTQLERYPLPDRLAGLLRKVDTIAQNVARMGGDVPTQITLTEGDYVVIDRIVRETTGGRVSARNVHFNGRHLRVGLAA